MLANIAPRHPELMGRYSPLGSYRLNVSSGAVTTIAERSATAGHLLSWRWGDTTGVHAYVYKILAKFTLTTAYGTAQETGCDLITAPAYTVAHTGATAVTLTGNKFLQHLPASKLSSCRVADTGALTAGTHTLDANPISTLSDWSAAIGATVPLATSGAASGPGALYDAALNDGAPLVFAQDQGFVIRNLILMGATGVGRWDFTIVWDEGTPA